MRVILSILLFMMARLTFSQSFTYSYNDPCTGVLKTINIPTDGVTITYYGQINTFQQSDFQNGNFNNWSSNIYNTYGNNNPCGSIIGISTGIDIGLNSALNTISILNSLSALSDLQSSMGSGGSLNTMSAIESAKSSSKKKDKSNSSESKSNSNGSNSSGSSSNNTPGSNTSGSNGTSNSESGNVTSDGSSDVTLNSGGETNTTNSSVPTNGVTVGSNSQNDPNVNSSSSSNTPESNSGSSSSQNTSVPTNGTTTNGSTPNSTASDSNGSNGTNGSTTSGQTGGGSGSTPSGSSNGSTTSGSTSNQTTGGTNTNGSTPNGNSSGSNGSTTSGSTGSTPNGNSSGSNGSTTSNDAGNGSNSTNTETNSNSGSNTGSDGTSSKSTDSNSENATTSQSSDTPKPTEKGSTNVLGGSVVSIQKSTEKNGGKPSVILSSDFTGFNFKQNDVTYGGKGTGGFTSMRWDGRRTHGFLVDYTTAMRGPNFTAFYAFIHKKRIDLISGTLTTSFLGKGSIYGTIALGQMWTIKKNLKVIYMATSSFGQVYQEKFLGTAFIAGGMYDWKASKRIDVKFMNLFIYAPYVSYYNDLVLKSPYVIMPIIGTNIGITKKFKLNINFGSTYAINQNIMNFTLMFGTRLAI